MRLTKFEWFLFIAVGLVTVAILSLVAMNYLTDATLARFQALGDPANITCYSGGIVIYEGRSTGKVISPENSDGYIFMDAETLRAAEVSGSCVITYGDE